VRDSCQHDSDVGQAGIFEQNRIYLAAEIMKIPSRHASNYVFRARCCLKVWSIGGIRALPGGGEEWQGKRVLRVASKRGLARRMATFFRSYKSFPLGANGVHGQSSPQGLAQPSVAKDGSRVLAMVY
jgi:hypothetical protein